MTRALGTLLLAALAAGCVRLAPGEAKPSSGPGGGFLISHWSFPKNPAPLQQFAADGFNTVIAVPEELPLCREHGLKAILATDAGTAKGFAGDPAVWGYFVLDEPARKKIPYADVAARVAEFHQLDAQRPAYVNLNELDDPAEFIRAVRPRILSYDYYQWWSGQERFFPLLERFSRAAREAGIPWIGWAEAVCVPGGPIPNDNLAKINLSVNCLLAYGASGIQWWAWRDFNRDAGTVNARLRRVGPVLAALRHAGAYHTAPVPEGARPIPPGSPVQTATPDLVLGFFRDDRKRDCVYVVNRRIDGAAEAILQLRERVAGGQRFDAESGQWRSSPVEVSGDRRVLRVDLEAGAAALIRLTGGQQP